MTAKLLLALAILSPVIFPVRAAEPPSRVQRSGEPGTNSVSAGEFLVEPPTLINLGFEWFIEGDDNRNAAVDVSYRKSGEQAWKRALPLLRLQGEHIYNGAQLDVVAPNMFAGSLLDLQPDTAYEARFVLSDPDGVRGEAQKIVTVRTRPEPQPAAGGRVFHVYPPGFSGAKLEPSFEGLMCAYNITCSGTDWATAGRPRVRPGDTILVHAGVYKYNRYEYTNNPAVNRTVPLDGTYYLTADGTAERPIVIKAAGDGAAVFDGDGNFALFDVKAADYTYFEGLTFRNTDIAIWAGTQFIAGSKGLTVKRSRFEDVGAGVFTNFSGSSNFYIADNWFFGRDDPNHVIGWASPNIWSRFDGVEGQKFPPEMASYVAVKVYGPGHVVAYNYVANFHDGIDIETYGNPDGSAAIDGPKYPVKEAWDKRPVAIDFYNNYMTNFHDNPFETDGGMHNVRVLRNMMINSASHAFCNQPALGGPVYWIGNIAYHLPGGSTRLTNGSAGVLLYHNTILSETAAQSAANVHWRNNLFLGQNSAPAIFAVNTFTAYSSSDYNGFRLNPGAEASFEWNSPAKSRVDYTYADHRAELETRRFRTLDDYSRATGQDQHSVVVDYDVFVNVPKLDAQDVRTIQKVYRAEDVDFRLKPGSAAIDRGVPLPNVNEGFAGRGPDLGALEAGAPLPHFGPRSAPWLGVAPPSGLGDPHRPVVNVGSASPPAPRVPAGEAAFRDLEGPRIRKDLEAIVGFAKKSRADGNRLWGRIAGFPSETATVEWAAQQFRDAGLRDAAVQPFTASAPMWWSRSWEVRVLGNARFGEGSRDVLLESAIPTAGSQISGGSTGSVTAALVDVGATTAPLPNADVKGKVAVQHLTPSGGAYSERGRTVERAQELAKRGAVAVLNVIEQVGNMHVRDFSNCGVPCFNLGGADGAFLESVMRSAAQSGLQSELRVQLSLQSEMLTGLTAHNAVATVPGASEEVVIVNAHADSWFDGAGDNGDGLAVLVALARHFAKPENRPDRTLVFVASAGHHGTGLNGPANFVRMNPAVTGKTVLVLNLEHIAQLYIRPAPWRVESTEQPMSFGISNQAPFLVDLAKRGMERYGFNLNPTFSSSVPGDLGGYAPIGVARVQAIHSGPMYHTSGDVLETISVPGLERAARFYAFFVREAAQAPRKALNP
jgi:peptidase M28-like protein